MTIWPLQPSIKMSIAITLLAASGVFWWGSGQGAISKSLSGMQGWLHQQPTLMVGDFAIEGASPETTSAIVAALDLKLPVSSLHLDLPDMQQDLMTLGAIEDVSLGIRPGGELTITVIERIPAFVWRTRDELVLLDTQGSRIMVLEERSDRADLPLLAGEGADKTASEAAMLLQIVDPISHQVRGLVRIGERRWNIELNTGQIILLPEKKPQDAAQRIVMLNDTHKLLDRDITVLDFRIPQRPTLRLARDAHHIE